MSLAVAEPPLQVKPASKAQVEEQPSVETTLPSSHASPATRSPSPHLGWHDEDPAMLEWRNGRFLDTNSRSLGKPNKAQGGRRAWPLPQVGDKLAKAVYGKNGRE